MITKQTSFNNFCDLLQPPRPQMLRAAIKFESEPRIVGNRYTLVLKRGNVIDIAEHHCKDCGALLYHNGYNVKRPVLDLGLGRRKFLVHRKRCLNCGEIAVDLSAIASPNCSYHENYRRRARRFYMSGASFSRVKQSLKDCFDIDVPYTTIVGWIRAVEMPLRKHLSTTATPQSGHWHHDETFLRIGGQKAYAPVTIDGVTGFVPAATISFKNDRASARDHLNLAKRPGRTTIKSLVMDGTNKIATLFKTRFLKEAVRQQCLMHLKWRATKKLKRLAGLGESSFKPLPYKFKTFRQRFYGVLDSTDETTAYIALERLRDVVEKANKSYITTLFKDIEAKLPQIIAWQREPNIAKTNNKCENFHQQLKYHVSFKARCRNMEAAQRIADFRVLRHNLSKFKPWHKRIQGKKDTFMGLKREKPFDRTLLGGDAYYKYEFARISRALGKYQAFWDAYLALQKR